MPWNSTWPLGTASVRANRTTGNQNTTYTETTMGNSIVGTNTATTRDHFWNVGSDEDGRHRFIQSLGFTVGGLPTDPVIGTGMDGVLYLKSDGLTPARVQGFYRNTNGVYQYIPGFKTGSISVNSTYQTITSVPPNVYGEIHLFRATTNENLSACMGHFKSTATVVEGWTFPQSTNGADTTVPLKLGSGSSASGLDLQVRTSDAGSHTFQYRLVYWAS